MDSVDRERRLEASLRKAELQVSKRKRIGQVGFFLAWASMLPPLVAVLLGNARAIESYRGIVSLACLVSGIGLALLSIALSLLGVRQSRLANAGVMIGLFAVAVDVLLAFLLLMIELGNSV